MNRFGLAVMLGMGLAIPAIGASPDPKDLAIPPSDLARARDLVQKLGVSTFREREQAQEDLARMGRLARPALARGVGTDPSPEVRARCARLLPRADAADLRARIDTFMADADGKFEHDLPAWKPFRQFVGADRPARGLYVEMLKPGPNLELLISLDHSSAEAGKVLADRRMGLFLQQNPGAFGRIPPGTVLQPRQPTLVDIALILLAESAVPHSAIPRPGPFAHITGTHFVQQAPAMNAINNPGGTPHGEAYRRVFVKWLDTRTAPDDLSNVAWMANNFRQIKETGPLLRRIVTTDGVQSHAKAQAMIFLLQRSKEEMPTIRSQFKNDAALNQMQIAPGVTIHSQVRDVALALYLQSEGQDLKKFGFEFQPGFQNAQVAQSYWGYGFKTEEDRTAAFKKIDEYDAKKKKTAPKK